MKIICFILILFLISCSNQDYENNKVAPKEPHIEKLDNLCDNNQDTIIMSGGQNDEGLSKLLIDSLSSIGVDTILNYKRTCIGCCDFYNVYSVFKGQSSLFKIQYGNVYNTFRNVKVQNDSIFLFTEKYKSILQAEKPHKFKLKSRVDKKAGAQYSTHVSIDHYCYTSMSIKFGGDSLVVKNLVDYYFDEYWGSDSTLRNINFDSNLNSKWNKLQSIIERDLSNYMLIDEREFELLRTTKT